MAYDERALRGVGGWLALLIILLGILSPLRTVIEAINLWSLEPGQLGEDAAILPFQLVETAVILVKLAGSFYVAWRLYAVHRPETVRIAIRGLWLLTIVLSLVEIILVTIVTGMSIGALLGRSILVLAQGLIFAGLWTAYLLRSRRVANTYTPDHDSADVFA